MSINRVVLTGRLTKDVELRATPSGNNVVSFTIAVDGFGRDQNNNPVNQASFINCVAWNQQAKFLSTYCKKGSLVALEGRLQTRSYDRKDGTKAYVTEVITDRVENLSPKDSSAAVSNDNGFSIAEEEDNIALSYSDDDLPF
jgi:single-strand DNA-binding protein